MTRFAFTPALTVPLDRSTEEDIDQQLRMVGCQLVEHLQRLNETAHFYMLPTLSARRSNDTSTAESF